MLGYVQIIIAMLIWGSAGVFGRWTQQPASVIVFYRVLFAAIALVAMRLVTVGRGQDDAPTRRSRLPWRLLVFSGVALALNWLFFFRAVGTTTVANAVLAYYVAPVFVTLLSPLLLKERLEQRTIIAAGLAMIGLGVMTMQGGGLHGPDLLGIGYGLIAALFYALVTIAGKRLSGVAPDFIVLIQTTVAVVLLAPFALPRLPWSAVQAWPTLGQLLILGVMGLVHTALALALYFKGMQQVKVQHVGVLGYLDPLSAVFFSWGFLHESPTLFTLVGGALILGATYLVLFPASRRVDAAPAD